MVESGTQARRGRRISRLAVWTLGLGSLIYPSLGTFAEGTQTGVLAGVVVDTDGEALPQVTVTLEGVKGKLQAVADEKGRFRFPALEVGAYEAAAELLGLQGGRKEVRVHIDRTTEVTLRLGEDSKPQAGAQAGDPAKETIQVVAIAPLIDPFETRVETSISREFLERLPVERFYQSVALLLPAVAGGADGNPNVSGSRRSNNLYLVDGVDTTDPTTGLFGLNLSYEAVDEVAVTVAALPVEWGRVSGAPINVVTRSGGQEFRGSARWVASGGSLTGDYASDEEVLGPEVEAANSGGSDLDNTLAVTFSGPLIPDRLWFFGAVERAENRLLRPSIEGSRWNDGATLDSNDIKLSARLPGGHSLAGHLITDQASFTAFSVFDRGPAENRVGGTPRQLSNSFIDRIPGDLAALTENEQEGDFSRLSWDWIVHQKLALSAVAAVQNRRLERAPRNISEVTGGAPHVGDNPAVDFSGEVVPGEQLTAVFNGITDEGFEERDRDQVSLSGAGYFRQGSAEHEVKAGLDLQRTQSRSRLNFSGPNGTDPATGRRTEGRLFIDNDFSDACLDDGRCLAFDPATGDFQPDTVLNFWARGAQGSEVETLALFASETLSLGRWLLTAGLRFESVQGSGGGRNLVDDESIAPRLGIKLDPKDNGKTLLSATYGRFYESFPQAFLDSFVVSGDFTGYTEYEWIEDFEDDCLGQDPADLASPCWQPLGFVPLLPSQAAEPNLGLERAVVDEVTLGIEHQLSANTDLRLTYVDRRWSNLWDDVLEFGSGEGEDFVTFEVGNLPQAERTYEGLSVLLKRRFSRRWQLLGSYTWSRAEGNLFADSGLSTFADFSETTDTNLVNRFGRAPYDRTHQIKIFSNYRLPLGRTFLTLGTALRFEDGAPIQQERFDDFGIRFLTRRGSEELDGLFQADLSAHWEITTPRGFDILAKVEAFNLTEEDTQLGAEVDVGSGIFGSPRSLADLQRPRSLRLTLGLRF